jgi:poly(A) polymerase
MAHVQAHMSHSKTGTVEYVVPYDNSRRKKPKISQHVVRGDAGMEKIRETVTRLLKTPEGLRELHDKIAAGGFQRSLPEVLNLYGLEQGAHHIDRDAFEHTMSVMKHLPEDANDDVRWATLLHDIGKAPTQTRSQQHGINFPGHARVGAEMARGVTDRLRFPKEQAKKIGWLVSHHDKLRTVLLRGDEKEAHKFTQHPHFDELMQLHNADVLSSGRDPAEVNAKIIELRAKQEQK